MKKISLIPLLLILVFVSCKSSKTVQSVYQPPVAITEEEKKEEAKEAVNKAITEKPIVTRTEGFTLFNPSELNNEIFNYYIIIGSFANANNARNLSDLLILKGFDPIILKSENGNLRVAVKGTNDVNEAKELVYRIRSISPEYSDAWMLKRK